MAFVREFGELMYDEYDSYMGFYSDSMRMLSDDEEGRRGSDADPSQLLPFSTAGD